MSYIIRKANPGDSRQLFDCHQRSINEICSKDYLENEIKAWSGFKYRDDYWPAVMEKDQVWVAEVDGVVHGFGHYVEHSKKIGEIAGLYFDPDAKGLGAGKEMFLKIVAEAKKVGLEKFILSSTKNALGFYEKMGFKITEPNRFIEIRGEKISCINMELIL